MGVGQLSESDTVDALRLPFYSSSHPTGSHGWRNQFGLGNPDLYHNRYVLSCFSFGSGSGRGEMLITGETAAPIKLRSVSRSGAPRELYPILS